MFKTFMVSLFSSALASFVFVLPDRNDPLFNGYLNYLDTYNKHYEEGEFWNRYENYARNMDYINNHTDEDFDLGVNQFTDMSRLEFESIYLTNRFEPHTETGHMSYLKNIPYFVDWRANGWVTDVKDQLSTQPM